MMRARRRFDQLPATTILLLVFLATLPVLKVSSNADTPGDQSNAAVIAVPAPASSTEAAVPVASNGILPADNGAATSRPVAQLIPPPDGLQSVSFTLAESDASHPQSGGALLVATGEYAIGGRSVTVSTFRADTTGAAPSLGAQPLALADGSAAWATPGLRGKTPNQIAFPRDGLIVTLTGDLPVDDLAALATHVVIRW